MLMNETLPTDLKGGEQMECQAIKERKDVTVAIVNCLVDLSPNASHPVDRQAKFIELFEPLMREGIFGTEKGMVVMFAVLHGIVNEYLDGGDQMVENCDCGQHHA